ncbi:MAG: PDZ domain-containing protein [Planctomycetaceae bacterium]
MSRTIPSTLIALAIAPSLFALDVAAAADPQDKSARKAASDSGRPNETIAADTRKDTNARATSPTARRGLGLQLDGDGSQALKVTAVEDGSPAARAGLKQNDRIVSIDGRPFNNRRQMQAYLASQWNRRVPMIIERDGQRYTVQFTAMAGEGDSAWLGVYLEEGDANMKGARITHVYPAGPAARAGLQTGDIITQVNNQAIDGSADLIDTVQDLKPQAEAQFVVLRDDEPLKVPVVLGSRNSSFAVSRGNEGMYGRGFRNNGDDDASEDDNDGRFDRSNDPFANVSPYSMQLEHDRRQSEQHERIENEIRLLREEISRLRDELKRK